MSEEDKYLGKCWVCGKRSTFAKSSHRVCGECEVSSIAKTQSSNGRGNPPTRIAARNNAKARIAMERDRQIQLWGDGPLPMAIRLAVLTEEVGEVARAICDEEGDAHLLEELVQVGAVALRWAEDLLLEMKR